MGDENVGKRKAPYEAMTLPFGHSKRLLWNNYIAAVNGALRHVAAQEAVTLLDYEGIMLQLPAAHAHAADGFHPQVRSRSYCLGRGHGPNSNQHAARVSRWAP